MARHNNFFNLDNSQCNSNTRNSSNRTSESHDNEQFRNYHIMTSPSRNVTNERYDNFINFSTSFMDNSNISTSHNVAHPYQTHLRPSTENIYCENQTKHFSKQNSSTNVCPFPNVLPPNIVQPPPSMEHHPPLQNIVPPFNPANSFPLLPIPSGLPSFPPPGPGVAPYLFSPPIYTSFPPPSIVKEEELKPSIQMWIKHWKAQRNTTQQEVLTEREPTKFPANKILISKYKNKVTNLATQLKELEKLTTHLQIMSKSLDETEWHVRKLAVVNQKKTVQDAMNDLETVPEQDIMSLLKKRKNKRIRLKRKREEFKDMKKDKKALCQLEHSRIDMWFEKMKEQVERTRTEEDIKKQADYVLSEVFHKKAEAKRMLSLLTTLGKLRNARIHDRESKGEFVSKEAAETFNRIIENLKKRWLNQINGYNLEEQGLRVMLSDAEVKRSNVEKSLNKQIHQQWLNIMFGDKHKHNFFLISNVDNLINVRKSWDQFIVKENSQTLGSSIPSGWISPAPPSNEIWASFLKN